MLINYWEQNDSKITALPFSDIVSDINIFWRNFWRLSITNITIITIIYILLTRFAFINYPRCCIHGRNREVWPDILGGENCKTNFSYPKLRDLVKWDVELLNYDNLRQLYAECPSRKPCCFICAWKLDWLFIDKV